MNYKDILDTNRTCELAIEQLARTRHAHEQRIKMIDDAIACLQKVRSEDEQTFAPPNDDGVTSMADRLRRKSD